MKQTLAGNELDPPGRREIHPASVYESFEVLTDICRLDLVLKSL